MTNHQGKRLVEYLANACTNTGQATFYNTREEQACALIAIHQAVMQYDRRIYALSAALPINDRNRQLVVVNLIKNGQTSQDQHLENRIINYVTRELPFNRALNMLVELCRSRVNNARLRRVCRSFYEEHGSAFHAIKYREKFRTIMRHCHIAESKNAARAEVHRYLFGKIKSAADVNHNALIRDRLAARTDLAACYRLPLDIGRDIAVHQHGLTAQQFTAEFTGANGKAAQGSVTRKESLRANKQVGGDVDYQRFTLFELLEHGHRVRDQISNEERLRFFESVHKKATSQAKLLVLPPRVAVVVDDSGSANGSDERAFHALTVIESTTRVLSVVPKSEVAIHFVSDTTPTRHTSRSAKFADLFQASGATDLRSPLACALVSRPQLVIIVSDGYENVAAGSVSQILATSAVRESKISVVHINPVAAAESGGVRKLAEDLPTFGVSSPQQLGMSLLLGESVSNPRRLNTLFNCVESALENNHGEVARVVQRLGREAATDGQ